MKYALTKEGFADIRRHGFVRVGLIVPAVHLADPLKNAASHLDMLRKVHEEGAQFALCPELGLTGYSCQDLFFQQVLLDEAQNALGVIRHETRDWHMLIAVGMPLAVGNAIYNCAVALYDGEVLAVVPKTFLPEYREFWEKRWFASGDRAEFDEVRLMGKTVPFGARVVLQHQNNEDFVVHLQICEDGWLRFCPAGEAALLARATVLGNLSASNVTIGKGDFRVHVLGEAASALDISAQLYVSAGFGESTTDVAWDGQGFMCERGETLAQTPRFSLKPHYLVHDIDVSRLMVERRMQNSFQDSADRLRRRLRRRESLFRSVGFGGKDGYQNPELYRNLKRDISKYPFVPSDPTKLNQRCEEVFNIQATALARRVQHLSGTKLIEGLSGGLDSTHALLVAVKAMDMLERSRKDIICLTMPGFGTTGRTKSLALRLADSLGVTIREVPITAQAVDDEPGIVEKLLGLAHHNGVKEDLTFENAQAWCRKIVELTTGAVERGIVLGTGDLSELAVGWCTMFGDHASHYGVNAGVPKTLIRFLVGWAAEHESPNVGVRTTLQESVALLTSPELTRPRNGEIAQITDEKIGPESLRDFFLYWGCRFGVPPSTIAFMANQAFQDKFTLTEVVKWQRVYWTRFFAAQYKRNCVPDSMKAGLVCLSPRGDWRMPSDASSVAWLADLDRVPLE